MHESPGIAALAASVCPPQSSPVVVTGGLDLVQSLLTEAHQLNEWVHARIQAIIAPTDKLRQHWTDYWNAFKLFYYRNWFPFWREPHALETARLWLSKAKEWLLLLDKLIHRTPYDDLAVLPMLTLAVSLGSLAIAIMAAASKGR